MIFISRRHFNYRFPSEPRFLIGFLLHVLWMITYAYKLYEYYTVLQARCSSCHPNSKYQKHWKKECKVLTPTSENYPLAPFFLRLPLERLGYRSPMSILVRSALLSRPNKAGLKCLSVRTYVRTVRPSSKSFFDFNEIWYVGRGRWAMHDDMQYDLIQGQGHEPLEVGNPSIFKSYLPTIYNGSCQLITDS